MVDGKGRLRLWNQQFLDLLGLSAELANAGVDRVLEKVDPDLPLCDAPQREYTHPDGRVINLVQGPMPGGGRVLTLTDISDLKRRQSAAERAGGGTPIRRAGERG
jgi:PAS domain-containing protein